VPVLYLVVRLPNTMTGSYSSMDGCGSDRTSPSHDEESPWMAVGSDRTSPSHDEESPKQQHEQQESQQRDHEIVRYNGGTATPHRFCYQSIFRWCGSIIIIIVAIKSSASHFVVNLRHPTRSCRKVIRQSPLQLWTFSTFSLPPPADDDAFYITHHHRRRGL
jgi:hypothetical protein